MRAVPPLILLLALAPACAGRPGHASAQSGHAAPAPAAATPADGGAADDQSPRELLGGLAVTHGGGPLTYNGYEVSKEVRLEKLPSGHANEVEYAVISRGGRRKAELRGFTETGFGAFLRMGLFPVLGGQTPQLVVEQTVHRGWRYWVVDLSSDAPRVLFDNGDYPVGHELTAADLDGDGRLELFQSLHLFWFFNAKLNNVNSPFISIIFKYDAAARRYAPANHEFQEAALRVLRGAVEKVGRERAELKAGAGSDGDLLGAVLEVSLSYLYAGREAEGWAFYEQHYDSPDSGRVKAQVRKALASDPVYRAITRGARRAAARD
jgi:hypothetical protein